MADPEHLEIAAQLRAFGSSTVGAVLDDMGLDGLITKLRPIAPGFRFAGPAFTAKLEVGELGAFPPQAFNIGAYIDQPPRGYVVAVDAGGAPVSALGGIAVRVAQLRGLAAIVIDGGSRDLDETLRAGFPLSYVIRCRSRVAAVCGWLQPSCRSCSTELPFSRKICWSATIRVSCGCRRPRSRKCLRGQQRSTREIGALGKPSRQGWDLLRRFGRLKHSSDGTSYNGYYVK